MSRDLSNRLAESIQGNNGNNFYRLLKLFSSLFLNHCNRRNGEIWCFSNTRETWVTLMNQLKEVLVLRHQRPLNTRRVRLWNTGHSFHTEVTSRLSFVMGQSLSQDPGTKQFPWIISHLTGAIVDKIKTPSFSINYADDNIEKVPRGLWIMKWIYPYLISWWYSARNYCSTILKVALSKLLAKYSYRVNHPSNAYLSCLGWFSLCPL